MTQKNNFAVKSLVFVYRKRGTVTVPLTAMTIQMNRKPVDKFLASQTISNVTIHNVFSRHISVMAETIAVMVPMKTIGSLVEHLHSS